MKVEKVRVKYFFGNDVKVEGADKAEDDGGILTAIFVELFNPILETFALRVGSVARDDVGSVVQCYNCTLNFLTNVQTLFSDDPGEDFATVVMTLAKPFKSFKDGFSAEEAKGIGRAMKGVNDITQATFADISRPASSETPQREGQESPHLLISDGVSSLRAGIDGAFAFMEGSLYRYSVLLSGYRSEAFANMLDDELTSLAKEVTRIVSLLSSVQAGIGNFDWEQVEIALGVMELAQELLRRAEELKSKLKEIEDGVIRGVKAAESWKQGNEKGPLTCAQVKALIAVCETFEDSSTSLVLNSPVTTKLPPPCVAAFDDLHLKCRLFAFGACFSVPRRAMRGISSMPCWKLDASKDPSSGYSVLPQEYVTVVGEHLLALMQRLEEYVQSFEVGEDGLGKVFVGRDIWRCLFEALHVPDVDEGVINDIVNAADREVRTRAIY